MDGNIFNSKGVHVGVVRGDAIFGLEQLDEREAALFRKCTGRTKLPTGPVNNLTLLIGRRGGKDRFLSAVAIYRAALSGDWNKFLSAGEQGSVILIGTVPRQRLFPGVSPQAGASPREMEHRLEHPYGT